MRQNRGSEWAVAGTLIEQKAQTERRIPAGNEIPKVAIATSQTAVANEFVLLELRIRRRLKL
jgi:hypothetical protein